MPRDLVLSPGKAVKMYLSTLALFRAMDSRACRKARQSSSTWSKGKRDGKLRTFRSCNPEDINTGGLWPPVGFLVPFESGSSSMRRWIPRRFPALRMASAARKGRNLAEPPPNPFAHGFPAKSPLPCVRLLLPRKPGAACRSSARWRPGLWAYLPKR